MRIPSREQTYPTWGKGKSSSKVALKGDMPVPKRAFDYVTVETSMVSKDVILPHPPLKRLFLHNLRVGTLKNTSFDTLVLAD